MGVMLSSTEAWCHAYTAQNE